VAEGLRDELVGIQTGRVEDRFGWLREVAGGDA